MTDKFEYTHRPPFYRRPEVMIPTCFTLVLLGWLYWARVGPMPQITEAFLFFLAHQP